MRFRIFAMILFMASMTLVACSEDDDNSSTSGSDASDDGGNVPSVICGEGTTFVNGRCVPISDTACGPGTVWSDGQCVPADPDGVPICGPGTVAENGQCVPTGEATETTCGAGTLLYQGACVVDTAVLITCGLGTVEDRGKCVPAVENIPDGGVCGTGTELQAGVCVPNLDVCGQGTVDDNGICVLAPESCAEGTTFDVVEFQCVDDSDIACGPGTELNQETQNCVPTGSGGAVCGAGTELVDSTCVPDIDGCGQGTVKVDTECVVAATACGAGTSYDEGSETCVSDSEVSCGSGTVFDSESSTCIADGTQGSSCGTGTQLVEGFCVPDIDGCGPGTVEDDGECVAAPSACASGTTFDQGLGQCVSNDGVSCGTGTTEESGQCVVDASACGTGTTFDSETGTCVGVGNQAACGVGTSYDPVSQTCLPGTILLGDCEDAPTELSSRVINEDLTLTAGCYTAPNGLDLRAQVNFSPGVTLFVGDGKNIEIRSNGRLNAPCLEENPCEIVGTTEGQGTWVGIVAFSNVEANNVLQWVTIANAGQDGVSMQINYNTLFDRMEHVTIEDGRGFAIRGELPRVLNDITVRNHEAGSIRTRLSDVVRLPVTLDIIAESGFDTYLEIEPNNVGAEVITVKKLPMPYLWDSSDLYDARGPLVFEPGVEMAFTRDGGITVPNFVDRRFRAVGTEQEPIIFRGLEAERGYWRGINLAANDAQNGFEWVEISDAGLDSDSACLTIGSNSLVPTFNNVTIRSCQGYALFVDGAPEVFGEFENVWLTDSLAPLKVRYGAGHPEFVNESTDLTGNDRDEIDVFGTCTAFAYCPIEDYTSIDFPVPLIIYTQGGGDAFDTFTIGNRAYLTGGEYVFRDITAINSQGDNFGLGDDETSLILRGEFSTPGSWEGVRIENGAGFGNYFRNVTISDAGARELTDTGFEGFYNLIIREDVRIADIDGLTIENGFGAPIFVDEGVVVDSCTNVDLSDFAQPYAVGPGAEAFNIACGLAVPD